MRAAGVERRLAFHVDVERGVQRVDIREIEEGKRADRNVEIIRVDTGTKNPDFLATAQRLGNALDQRNVDRAQLARLPDMPSLIVVLVREKPHEGAVVAQMIEGDA